MRPFIGIANIGPLSDPAQATHTPDTLLNLAPFLLGGLKQFVAFACALIGKQRIAAGGEAFTRKFGRSDLGEIAFIEKHSND